MNVARLGRALIAVAVFLFAVSAAIYFGRQYSQRGQVDRNNVFCLACLENHYYRTKAFKWETEPNYDSWQELIYLPADLGISERAMLIKMLTNFSNVAAQTRFKSEPLAAWADQFYRAWGRNRPNLKIRLPYFARIENHQPSWPSEPEHDLFGAVASAPINKEIFGLILIAPTQTEFDATLSLAHSLFLLFDPAARTLQDQLKPILLEHWLNFRAYIAEIELWHLFNRYFESTKLSYYHYHKYPGLWQQLKDKNYFGVFAWMIERAAEENHFTDVRYFEVLPALQGKMPVQSLAAKNTAAKSFVDLFNLEVSPFSAISWPQFFSPDTPFDGLLLATRLRRHENKKENFLSDLLAQMNEFIKKKDPNFHNERADIVFSRFYEILGADGVLLPERLSEKINPNIRGEF